jgi:hypothetical protein
MLASPCPQGQDALSVDTQVYLIANLKGRIVFKLGNNAILYVNPTTFKN